MDEFEIELKLGFLDEASQLLTDAELSLLTLEQDPQNEKIIDQLFRLAHNLKGSSKAVGFPEMGEITHRLESLLLKIKSKEIIARTDTVNLFLRSLDALQKSVVVFKADLNGHYDFTALTQEVEDYLNRGSSESEAPESPQSEAQEVLDATEQQPEIAEVPEVRAELEDTGFQENLGEDSFKGLEPVVHQSLAQVSQNSEPVHVEPEPLRSQAPSVPSTTASTPTPPASPQKAPAQPTAPVQSQSAAQPSASTQMPTPAAGAAGSSPAAPVAVDESIRVSLSRIEQLINYVGELVIFQTVLKEQVRENNPHLLKKTADQLGKVTKEVQGIAMSLRMVPMKQTFQKMQRIVRDTSAYLGKKINLNLTGENTELDKTVLENISDPLLHLIRNACDHGIETADVRLRNGKPEAGNIHLRAFHQGGQMIIEVQDDGGGINPEELKKKAIKKGLIKEGTILSDKDALQVIFLPGFTTKVEVSDISGRGVGLDVVKSNIAKLQGDIQLSTELGKGSCFAIRLPLTMAIIDAMVIRMDQDRYVIPLGHIQESIKPNRADVQSITGVGEVFLLRGESLPLYHLSRLLGKKGRETNIEESILIVMRSETPFALLVDDIIGQQQVVIKRLGKELQYLSGYTGSAILGDGRPALILEVQEMLKTYKPDFYAGSSGNASTSASKPSPALRSAAV